MSKPPPRRAETQFIQSTYDQLAQVGVSDLCCSPFDLYGEHDLAMVPDDVLRLSSGCGHPVDDAAIWSGSIVLDIGSGAGADCLLAAHRTGPTGQVIGVDPSPAMRQRAEQHRDELGLTWIRYLPGTADQLPVPDSSVDFVISNCVLSLSAEPPHTWSEIGRVLRPGGRAVVSDIVSESPEASLVSKTRCETGVNWDSYQQTLHSCGFSGIQLLRVRQARFRDGATAQSVTFQARIGMPKGHVTIQLLHHPDNRAKAQDLLRALSDAAQRLRLPMNLHLLSTADQSAAAIAELLLGVHENGQRTATLAAALDGRAFLAEIDDVRSAADQIINEIGSRTG